jgi:hypothetical protein
MGKRKQYKVAEGIPKSKRKGRLLYVKGKSIREVGKKKAVKSGLKFERDDSKYLYFVAKSGAIKKVRKKNAE